MLIKCLRLIDLVSKQGDQVIYKFSVGFILNLEIIEGK